MYNVMYVPLQCHLQLFHCRKTLVLHLLISHPSEALATASVVCLFVFVFLLFLEFCLYGFSLVEIKSMYPFQTGFFHFVMFMKVPPRGFMAWHLFCLLC